MEKPSSPRRRPGGTALPVILAVVLSLVAGGDALGQAPATTIYLVRHAEVQPDGSSDPTLSRRGLERARALAASLAAAGLDEVHATGYRRTLETARVVADRAGLEVREYDPRDLSAFADRLRGAGGVHLVVGHSNTTPALVDLLGGEPGPPIEEDEHGRVYHLTIPAGGAVRTAVFALAPPPAGTPSGAATVAYLDVPGRAELAPPFSEAVRVGDMLYLSGQVGTRPGTMELVEGGIVAESRQTMDNIQAILERHGSSMDRVVKCTVMIDDIAAWGTFNEVYRTYFPGPMPARSAFGADGLALGAAVEVECWATVDASR